MSTEASDRPQRRADLRVREAGGFSDVIDAQDRVIFRLNDTARALWEVCDGKTTLEEMFHAALQLFDGPAELIRADLVMAIEEFHRQGLLEEDG